MPLELIHIAKIVLPKSQEKHFLCIVMLTRNERPTFHVVEISTGIELREVNHVILGNLG